MKTLTLSSAIGLAVLASGCVADDAPILLQNFRSFEDPQGCVPVGPDGLSSGRGFLDVAGARSYLKWLEVESQLQPVSQPNVAGGGGQTVTESPNEAIIDTVTLEYASEPSLGLQTVSYPTTFTINPATSEENANLMLLELLPGDVGDTVAASVPVGDRVTLNVTVTVSGRLRSGQAFTSNSVTYPINLGNSGATCAAGEIVARNGVCGNPGGQDAIPVVCCPETNPACATATN